jgi:hypothetical protein
MAYIIISKNHYHETMLMIFEMMKKGEPNLSSVELLELSEWTKAAEIYEDKVLNLSFRKELENQS